MRVQKENLSVPQGTTYRHKIEYRYPDGSPVDLTGFTARMQIRETVDSAVVLWEADFGSDIVIDGKNGDVFLKIPAVDTETWGWSMAMFDLEIISQTGEVTRIMEGRVRVTPEVTR